MHNSLTRFIRRLFASSALTLMLFVVADAQDKSKQDAPPKPANTVDAWKQALPENEQANPSAEYSQATRAQNEKALEEIKKGLIATEHKWMEALKLRDESALAQIVGDDFTINSPRPTDSLVNKTQYLKQSLNDLKLSSYNLDKLEVRVYGRTAVVNGWFTQQAVLASTEWSGNFLFTDVWVYRNGSWKVVSRHLSASPKT
jgi:hypothetical protein